MFDKNIQSRGDKFSIRVLEFTEWKSVFEQSSGSKYVKNCGSKGKSENQTTEYYYCNRTGLCKFSFLYCIQIKFSNFR